MAAKSGTRQYVIWSCILMAAAIAALLAWYLLPIKEWLQALTQWIHGLGVLGIVVYVVVYIVIVVLLAPAEILSIGAGFIFGLWAIPLVVVAATIGATLAFLVARYLLRDKVVAFARKRPLFDAVDKAVGHEGWKVVALLRLNPLVPFNLQNYFFGVTKVGLWPYAIATFFGIMPGAAAFVYIGTLGQTAGAGQSSGVKIAFLVAGLIATIIALVIIARRAKAMLAEAGVKDSSDKAKSRK